MGQGIPNPNQCSASFTAPKVIKSTVVATCYFDNEITQEQSAQ